MAYTDYYGALASYFGQSGGTNSPGKAGGAGYNSDTGYYAGPSQQGDTQQASAQSGSGWISAAASTDSTDKSNFSTPFQQGFGGIANYNVTDSPGAGVSSAAPITGPPNLGALPVLSGQLSGPGGGLNIGTLLLLVAIAVIAVKFVR